MTARRLGLLTSARDQGSGRRSESVVVWLYVREWFSLSVTQLATCLSAIIDESKRITGEAALAYSHRTRCRAHGAGWSGRLLRVKRAVGIFRLLPHSGVVFHLVHHTDSRSLRVHSKRGAYPGREPRLASAPRPSVRRLLERAGAPGHRPPPDVDRHGAKEAVPARA